jgi:hypothetical protein
MVGNLFIVSRVGQLRNAKTFIREHDAAGNHLAVLGTADNPLLSERITANIEPGMFDRITMVDLPLKPVTQGPHKNEVIYHLLEDLLVTAASEGVVNLFLCNSDNFYLFFQRIIERRELGMKLNLLEEGLGTYANAGSRRYVRDTTADWREVKRRLGRIFQPETGTGRAIVSAAAAFVSWVLGVDVVQFVRSTYASATVPAKYRYGTITHFDAAYVYFPERIHPDLMRIDDVQRLGFELEHSTPPETLASVEDDETVFLSQSYLPRHPYAYFSIVFDILAEMGVKTVQFKFHPRENYSRFQEQWERAVLEHPQLTVLTTPEVAAIPAEELMMAGKVKTAIGLTSTTLMYAQAFFPGVEVVSIGSRFDELASSDEHDIPKRALSEFRRDLEVFLDVSAVRQLGGS